MFQPSESLVGRLIQLSNDVRQSYWAVQGMESLRFLEATARMSEGEICRDKPFSPRIPGQESVFAGFCTVFLREAREWVTLV